VLRRNLGRSRFRDILERAIASVMKSSNRWTRAANIGDWGRRCVFHSAVEGVGNGYRFSDRLVELRVLLGELWNLIKSPGSKAQHVGDHQDLPIAEWPGSNADGWHRQRIGHRLRPVSRTSIGVGEEVRKLQQFAPTTP
jgi:hypothetical protein